MEKLLLSIEKSVREHFFYLTHGYYLNDGSGKQVAGSNCSAFPGSKAMLIFSI